MAHNPVNSKDLKTPAFENMFRSLVILSLAILVQPTLAAVDYITAFSILQSEGEFVWPTPASNAGSISSTFGPRIRVSCDCDDFHRGIDIHGNIGDDVLATYGGKVVQVTTYNDGGKTIVIEHNFNDWTTLVPGHTNTKKWYTAYMHLNDWYVQVGDIVLAGEVIGELGETGSAESPHLHHEVRVGTRCSLEYALGNPSSTCNTKGYDPHVHPMLVYPDMISTDITATISQTMDGNSDGIVHIETPDVVPNVNRYTVAIINTSDNSMVDAHVLDLNLRYGFDASSTSALDTFDTSKPYLSPISFGYTASTWSMDLVIPASWIPSKTEEEIIVIQLTDVWGVDQPDIEMSYGVAW
jgi:murein DD-endopeptidase MepM/ murein hydrolase activator NlpD